MARIKVVIVNFNAGKVLADCVAATLASSVPVSVTVADNASTDGSLDHLARQVGDDPRLEIIRNPDNPGFSRAVNQAVRGAGEPYVLVLNPDCVPDADAIECLASALDDDPEAAVAGAWVTNDEGRVQKGTWRQFPDPWRSLMTVTGLHRISGTAPSLAGVDLKDREPPGETIRVDAVSGACLMLRTSLAERVGYYDEGYAMHCEDLDLMYRLSALGHHCLLVPSARAVHAGGISSASRPWWVHRQKHAGMQRYFRKFQAASYPVPVRVLVYAGIWAHYVATLPAVLLGRFKTRP